ncbi:uncharacterized protein LOC109914494 [Rhincodon typus]|uniref:uncharacterized protein LOC109914494 n=1 Tax=Rhincodon typus TaxID=259920 RepID=UPI002030E7AD|nr:uncharacterized protein LOC109914494 [Rhincodon typus]
MASAVPEVAYRVAADETSSVESDYISQRAARRCARAHGQFLSPLPLKPPAVDILHVGRWQVRRGRNGSLKSRWLELEGVPRLACDSNVECCGGIASLDYGKAHSRRRYVIVCNPPQPLQGQHAVMRQTGVQEGLHRSTFQ